VSRRLGRPPPVKGEIGVETYLCPRVVQELTRRPAGEILLGYLLIERGAGLTLDAQSKRKRETLSHVLNYRKEGFDIGCVARPHLATDRSTLVVQGHADDHPRHSDQLLEHPARYSAQANPHRHLPRPSCPRTHPLPIKRRT
jgi:hypothetical protein